MTRQGIGGHQAARPETTTWVTPPHIIPALGGWESFDLDPCALAAPPWPTARLGYTLPTDGLAMEWDGRVWLNPPYTTGEVEAWLRRLGDHGRGTALIFARTETESFQDNIWARAHGLLFLAGRLHFHYPDGVRAKANAGAPSVLCAFGVDDMDRLAASALPGAFVPLRLARAVLVQAADVSWCQALAGWAQGRGPISVSDAYRAMARHPKTQTNPNWRAKVRQTLQRGPFERIGHGVWAMA